MLNHQRTYLEEIHSKGVIQNREARDMTETIDEKLRKFKIKNPDIKPEVILEKIFTNTILSNFIDYLSDKEDDKKLFQGVSKVENIVSHE